jgi:hypothetical protein
MLYRLSNLFIEYSETSICRSWIIRFPGSVVQFPWSLSKSYFNYGSCIYCFLGSIVSFSDPRWKRWIEVSLYIFNADIHDLVLPCNWINEILFDFDILHRHTYMNACMRTNTHYLTVQNSKINCHFWGVVEISWFLINKIAGLWMSNTDQHDINNLWYKMYIGYLKDVYNKLNYEFTFHDLHLL